jgi:hypothetical protein
MFLTRTLGLFPSKGSVIVPLSSWYALIGIDAQLRLSYRLRGLFRVTVNAC